MLEIKEDEGGSTYRLIYTVRFPLYIYALHVFQKKSHRGSETPKSEVETVHARLATAEKDYEQIKSG